jgi:hypothetical protein
LIRFLSLIAATAFFAGPAFAGDFHVRVDGRSEAAVQQDIQVAAKKMCSGFSGGTILAMEPASSCLKFAVRDAQAQLSEVRLAQSKASNVRVASTR